MTGRGIRRGSYGLPRKLSAINPSRDPGDRTSAPEFAALASASEQSTSPFVRMRQVLLSMMRSRQRSPVGGTTSMEAVLRLASDEWVCDTGLVDACDQFA